MAKKSCQKVFKQRACNGWWAAFELTPNAQVLEGPGIQEHFEIQNLENGIFKGFQEVFSSADAMFFRQNTRNTGNNAVEMSHAIHNIARFKRSTYLNLFKYEVSVFQNWETDALQFYLMVFIFCQQFWQKEIKVAG